MSVLSVSTGWQRCTAVKHADAPSSPPAELLSQMFRTDLKLFMFAAMCIMCIMCIMCTFTVLSLNTSVFAAALCVTVCAVMMLLKSLWQYGCFMMVSLFIDVALHKGQTIKEKHSKTQRSPQKLWMEPANHTRVWHSSVTFTEAQTEVCDLCWVHHVNKQDVFTSVWQRVCLVCHSVRNRSCCCCRGSDVSWQTAACLHCLELEWTTQAGQRSLTLSLSGTRSCSNWAALWSCYCYCPEGHLGGGGMYLLFYDTLAKYQTFQSVDLNWTDGWKLKFKAAQPLLRFHCFIVEFTGISSCFWTFQIFQKCCDYCEGTAGQQDTYVEQHALWKVCGKHSGGNSSTCS